MPRRPLGCNNSDSDSSSEDEYDDESSTSSSDRSVSTIAATDGSETQLSSDGSDDSFTQSDVASQTFSERSSSLYQTDVTLSSSDSEVESDIDVENAEEEAASDAESQRSYGSDYSNPIADMSDNEEPPVEMEENAVHILSDDSSDSEPDEIDVGHDDSVVVVNDDGLPGNGEVRVLQAAQVEVVEPLMEPQAGPSGQQTANETESKTCGSARKRPASEMEGDDDDAQMCLICYDAWEGTGPHRIVSLKCGHLFGKSCVEKWLRMHKKCPKCNAHNKVSDVRKIFAPVVKVKETVAEKHLQAQLAKALNEKREVELKLLRKEQEMMALQEAQRKRSSACAPARSSAFTRHNSNSNFDRKFNFKLTKDIKLANGGGRVMAHCQYQNQLAVSCSSPMAGFYGLKMFSCERNFLVYNIDSFHAQPIRDLAFHPVKDGKLLLTVSLDKTAKMIDCRYNCVVQTYKTQNAGWSCCWDSTGSISENVHNISVGMANGEICRYDIRMPSPAPPIQVLGERTSMCPGQDITGVHSLVSVPAGESDSLPRGALLASHLKSCHIFSGEEDAVGAKIDIDGNFHCMRAEPVTGHILISNKYANHQLMRLRKEGGLALNSVLEPVLPIVDFSKPQSILARSAVGTYLEDGAPRVLVAGNEESSRTAKLWSLSDGGSCIATMPLAASAMDICFFTFNNDNYLAYLATNNLSIYEMIIK